MSNIIDRIKENYDDIYPFHNPLEEEEFSYEMAFENVDVILYKSLNTLKALFLRSSYCYSKNEEETLKGLIPTPPVFDERFYTEAVLSKYLDKNSETINKFINVMETNFTKEQLQILYRNLKSLKIQKKKSIKGSVGLYKDKKNIIVLLKDGSAKTSFHELFHMASTIYRLGRCLGGLALVSDELFLAGAINEGYTDIMANRYFDVDLKDTYYYRELVYAKGIEDVVGKDYMENCYMTANPKQLMNELIKYTTFKEMFEFFGKMDDVLYYSQRTLKDTKFNRVRMNDVADKGIQINLWLISLKQKKQEIYETVPYKEYDEYKKYFMVDGKEMGKNVYYELISLYNCYNKRGEYYFNHEVAELVKLIGYDKLEDIVLNTGINGLVDELKQYMLEEDIPGYLEAFNEYLMPCIKYDDQKYLMVKRYHIGLMAAKYVYDKPIRIKNDDNFLRFHYFFREYIRDYFFNISYYVRNKKKTLPIDFICNNGDNVSDFYDSYVVEHGTGNMCKLAKLFGYEELFWILMLDDMDEFIGILGKYFDNYDIIDLMEVEMSEMDRMIKKMLTKMSNVKTEGRR